MYKGSVTRELFSLNEIIFISWTLWTLLFQLLIIFPSSSNPKGSLYFLPFIEFYILKLLTQFIQTSKMQTNLGKTAGADH